MTQQTKETRQLKIVIVGHVDHGKSTLVGRLIHETGSLPDGKLDAIKAMSEKRGMPFEWAFLMDAIQAERDQGITIDTTQIWFHTKQRPYVIIDAPGHKEFLKNMVTGAASSEAALLLIDAHEGVQEQSRRHGYLLHLLGVKQVAVLVNKMDLVGYSADRFGQVAEEYRAYLRGLGVTPDLHHPDLGPRGRQHGRPLHRRCRGTRARPCCRRWTPSSYTELPTERPLRVPVQDVYKFDQRRIIAGRVESGTVRVGDEVVFSPSNKTAVIKSIESWHVPEAPELAQAGQSIGVTLTEQIFVERGEVMSHLEHAPIESNVFKARLFWLGHKPLMVGNSYTLKLGTMEAPVTVEAIDRVIDTSDLSSKGAERLERNGAGEVVLRTKRMLALDEHVQNPITGRFVLVEDYMPMGGGIITHGRLPGPAPADHRPLDQHHGGRPCRDPRGALGPQRPQGCGALVHRPVRRRQVDPGAGARARAVRQGLPGLRAGRRQHPRRAQRQSGLQPGGPGREHPPRRRGGLAVRRCRASSSSARSSRPTAPTASGRARR